MTDDPVARHTPGPWTIERAEGVPDELEIHARDFRLQVASVWDPDDREETQPTMHANARLIAAAPELLAALKELRDVSSQRSLILSDWIPVNAAIRKAEGR